MKKKQLFNYSFDIQQPHTTVSIEQLLNNAVRCHQQGQLQQAEQLYNQILQQQPKHAYVLNLLGVLISQKGDHRKAEKLLSRAIKIDPDIADYHNNLGLTLQHSGKLEQAAKAFKKATRLDPGHINAWFSLGNVNLYLKKPEAVIDAYRKVIEIAPDFLPAYNNLGNIYRELGRFDEGMEMFNKVLALKPDFAEAWYNIGVVYMVKEEGGDAIAAFERAIALKNDYARAYAKIGSCRRNLLNDAEGALEAFDKAIEINPGFVAAYLFKAETLQGMGQFDESEEILRKVLELDESAVNAYLQLVNTKGYKEDDLGNLQLMLDDSRMTMDQLIPLHFSLGKIFDDQKEYAKAFPHFRKGNELYRNSYQYDENETRGEISRMIENFSQSFIQHHSEHGVDTALPVFIVGMPRSGTTLTEQIIASHPEVFGAGELSQIGYLATNLPHRLKCKEEYPDCIKALTAAVINDLANEYLAHIHQLDKEAGRITDKMPINFLHLGLIAILFPEARIIHCQRHPLDTCLSIYTQKFRGSHPYAYDLTELGLYYRQYTRLMDHWHKVLGPRIFIIQYEELLEDLEFMARKLIDFIGLSWDERCLQFYQTERSVRTASQWQVRQQLYTSSRERWRHYEPWLKPLMNALGDVTCPQ